MAILMAKMKIAQRKMKISVTIKPAMAKMQHGGSQPAVSLWLQLMKRWRKRLSSKCHKYGMAENGESRGSSMWLMAKAWLAYSAGGGAAAGKRKLAKLANIGGLRKLAKYEKHRLQ
jgi:hypothetical protein